MSDRAGEIREFVDAFERDGVEAVLGVFDPEIHWHSPPEWMDQSGYYGRAGLRELDALWRENFDDFGLALAEVRTVGDRVIVLLTQHGRIKGSGQLVEQKVSWLIEYGDDGLIRELRAYFTWEEAFEAAAP